MFTFQGLKEILTRMYIKVRAKLDKICLAYEIGPARGG